MNKSSETASVYWLLMVDKEQQIIKQIYINYILNKIYVAFSFTFHTRDIILSEPVYNALK